MCPNNFFRKGLSNQIAMQLENIILLHSNQEDTFLPIWITAQGPYLPAAGQRQSFSVEAPNMSDE